MHLSEPEELCMFKTRDHAEDTRLVAELHVVLKPDEIVTVGALVLLAKLNDRIGPSTRSRIVQSRGLHGSEAKRVLTAPGDLFNWQASFEVRRLVFLNVRLVGFGLEQGFY